MDLSGALSKKQAQLERMAMRIQYDQQSGKFFRLTQIKRNSLLVRLKKLTKRVEELKWQFKLAALGGLALTSHSHDAVAQSTLGPFQLQTRANNPLRYPLIGNRLKPTVVDLDNDGDYDIVTGEDYGYIKLYLNEGGPNTPKFTDYKLQLDDLSPISISGLAAPAFADLNDDGLLDLIVGSGGSTDRIQYFVNNGGTPGSATDPLTFTEQTGVWDEVAKTGNPFYSLMIPGGYPILSFINLDGDGDMDVLIGHNYSNVGDGEQVHYYKNDGKSNFTLDLSGTDFSVSPTIVGYSNYGLSPNLVDLDQDGQLDFVMGNKDGDLRFFKGNAGVFTEVNTPWVKASKTGSPVYGISLDSHSAPAFVDLDNDGDLDMVVGYDSYKYTEHPLAYFENMSESMFQVGNNAFELKENLDSPFNGIDVGQEAAPQWADIDGDGDLDAVIGSLDQDFSVLINSYGSFNFEKSGSIGSISTGNYNVKPVFVDIDNDNDQDLFVTSHHNIDFYRNDAGNFVNEATPIDFGALTVSGDLTYTTELSLAFMDIDEDGDFDAFIGGDGVSPAPSLIQFLENQGTPEIPNFVGVTEPSPFDTETFEHRPNIISVDMDNDGDLDIVLAETIYNDYTKYDNTTIRLFKNNNDGTFTEDDLPILDAEIISGASSIAFTDLDGDGDLDAFVGLGDYYNNVPGGIITYYLNQNPAPSTTVSSSTLVYIFGSGPAVMDTSITISDADSDEISKAVLAIQGYQTGDMLGFTPQGNVAGSFDTGSGILTLTGLAPISTYQDVLRSVTYDYTGAQPSSAGKSSPSGRTVVVNKSIDLTVFDSDGTTPLTQNLAVALTVPNVIPVVSASAGLSTYTGATPIIIDPTISVIDNDDADLAGAIVQISPSTFVAGEDELLFTTQNGITGTYNNGTGLLTLTGTSSVANYQTALQSVQYQNTSATPTGATRTIEFSVDDGEAISPITNKMININVPPPNQPPLITPGPLAGGINSIITLDLSTISSDPDGNLDATSYGIVQQPTSGVIASIAGTILTIDYSGSNFIGSDNMIIEVYDLDGERAEATLTITITNQAPVIIATQLNTVVQGIATIDLLTIVSDVDNNLDATTFNIVQSPISGAAATISGTTLTIDYSNTPFAGIDNILIEVFDLAGERAEAAITIQVDGEIIVRNGMSPNGDGKNDYFRLDNITTLGAANKVSIFNRWGDKVFEVENYDNQTKRFEGKSDSGNDLPSGVYFYKITFNGSRPELSGYLTLKR